MCAQMYSGHNIMMKFTQAVAVTTFLTKYCMSHCYMHNYEEKLHIAVALTGIRYWKESPSHPPLHHCVTIGVTYL